MFAEIDPDVALLQEVGCIPGSLRNRYQIAEATPTGRSGRPQKFKTAILAKGEIKGEIALTSELDWINRERAWFGGNIVACRVAISDMPVMNVISFYSPAWPVNPARLDGIDLKGIKLEQNRDLWCTEILWSLLIPSMQCNSGPWVVGGDFNSSETFDAWRVGGRGNSEIISRLNLLGLKDCLRTHHGRLVPTFRNPRGGAVIHQIDHLYVSDGLLNRLRECHAPMEETIFAQKISDHLPIVADFKAP